MKIYSKLTFENRLGLIFWVPIGICFLIQAFLSIYDPQNLVVLSIVLLIFTLLYLIVKTGSLYNTPILLSVLYIFNNIIFAFFVKTLLLQPLSSNLYSPGYSYFATWVATFALFLAVFASKAIKVGKPLFKPVKNLHYLKWLTIYSFVLGFSAWVFNQIVLINRRADSYDYQQSFGGFAILDNLFYMSIISGTAFVLISTNKKKSINIYLAVVFLLCLVMALVESRKMGIGLLLVSHIGTCIFFRKRITNNQIITFFAVVLFAFFVFTPIVHIYRSTIWFLPLSQKIEFLYKNINDLSSLDRINDYYRQIQNRKPRRYDYFATYMSFLDRFAAIQINDDLISATEDYGLSKSKFYFTDYTRILPGFLYPGKDTIPTGDKLRWEYGLKKYGQISFTTAPLICNAYSVGIGVAVFSLCFYIFLLLFLLFKKINWNLYENVYAIYFFVPFIFGIHQFSHDQFITKIFRELPINIFILYFFHITYVTYSQIRHFKRHPQHIMV